MNEHEKREKRDGSTCCSDSEAFILKGSLTFVVRHQQKQEERDER